MTLVRTNFPKRNVIRKQLELYVTAWNNCLKPVVSTMPLIILLRNSHPTYRPDFAIKLRDEGYISPEQANEFIKIPVRK